MDKNKMLLGLTNRDFSALGTILSTAAIGAGVHGLMYPLTEVAYGLSDNLVKNVVPDKYRKPLPQGYKPQIVKTDALDKEKAWKDHVKRMDAIDGDLLKGYTMTMDPKYANDTYQYLVSRGINPGKDGDHYLSSLKEARLDLSEDEGKKKGLTPDQKKALTVLGVSTLGAAALQKPKESTLKNIGRAVLKGAAITGGVALLGNALSKNKESEDTKPMAASDMSSGTFYVNTLRNPNLFYPVEYKKKPFRKVKAVYRADQPNIGYDYDKILNDETDEEYNKYLPIHNQAVNDITQIDLKGITEDELNLAINELAKKYPNKKFEINVKYKDMSGSSINDSFEMPIEDASFYNDNITGVAGRINTGHIKVGDSIDLNGKSYKISKINMFNKNLDEAQSGDNVEVLLEGLGRSGIRLDDSTKPNAKFALAEYTKDDKGRFISPTQILRSHKDMSKPEKYTMNWFEKNKLIPGRDLPSDYANKILEESQGKSDEVFDEVMQKYYNSAELKGLLKPNQSFYNGSKWQSNTEGFTEIEDGYDYVTLTKPIDNKTLREVKYSKGKLVSDKLIKSDKDMSMLNGLFNTSFDFATRGWDYPTPYFNEIPVNNVAQYKIDSDKLTSDMFHNQLNLSKSYEDKREDLWNSLMKNKFKGKSEMDIFGYPNSDPKWSISDRPWWYSDDQGSKLRRKYERKYNRLGNKTGYFRKLDAYTDLKYNDAKSIDEKYESDLKNLITKHGGTPGTPVSYYEGGNSPDDFYNGIGFKPIPKGYKLAYNDDHHLGMIDKSGKFIKKEFSKDMSMLNGLFR